MRLPAGRLLVTGAAGRIGRLVCRLARRAGMEVVPIDHARSDHHPRIDIRDSDAVARAVDGCRWVIHTAGLHAPHVGRFAEDAFWDVNVRATDVLLRRAAAVGVEAFVFSSTTAVFGWGATPGSPTRWFTEASEVYPRTIYHRTKLEAEERVHGARTLRFRTKVVRIGRCFEEPLPSVMVHRLCRGIDPRDAASFLLRSLFVRETDPFPTIATYPTPFGIADAARLGSEADVLIRERCPEVAAVFDRRGWVLPRSIDRVYDSALGCRLLGWSPRYGSLSVVESPSKKLEREGCNDGLLGCAQ